MNSVVRNSDYDRLTGKKQCCVCTLPLFVFSITWGAYIFLQEINSRFFTGYIATMDLQKMSEQTGNLIIFNEQNQEWFNENKKDIKVVHESGTSTPLFEGDTGNIDMASFFKSVSEAAKWEFPFSFHDREEWRVWKGSDGDVHDGPGDGFLYVVLASLAIATWANFFTVCGSETCCTCCAMNYTSNCCCNAGSSLLIHKESRCYNYPFAYAALFSIVGIIQCIYPWCLTSSITNYMTYQSEGGCWSRAIMSFCYFAHAYSAWGPLAAECKERQNSCDQAQLEAGRNSYMGHMGQNMMINGGMNQISPGGMQQMYGNPGEMQLMSNLPGGTSIVGVPVMGSYGGGINTYQGGGMGTTYESNGIGGMQPLALPGATGSPVQPGLPPGVVDPAQEPGTSSTQMSAQIVGTNNSIGSNRIGPEDDMLARKGFT